MEQLFTQIETRYGFALPVTFREFWRRGFCTILGPGCPGPDYLMLWDMEWMPLADIVAFEFQSYHLPGFVPFAITGGGDHWCWQPEFTADGKTRVLCCYHDCYDAEIYAPDFVSAIFRHIVEGAAGMQREAEAVETCRQELAKAIAMLDAFFSNSQRELLSGIIKRPIQTSRSTGRQPTDWYFLVSSRECSDIIHRELGPDYLNAKFRWMQPAA
jgi:hypothetical protein